MSDVQFTDFLNVSFGFSKTVFKSDSMNVGILHNAVSKRALQYTLVILMINCFVRVYGAEYSINVGRMKSALKELDKNLANRERYLDEKRRAIASLQANRNLSPVGNLEAIARAYVEFNNDSAIHYYTKALEIADTNKDKWRLTSARAAVWPQAGFIQQAIDAYNSIPVDSLSGEDLIEYYDNGRRMYSLITAFYSYYPDEALKYSQKVIESHEGLLASLIDEKDSPRYRLNYGEYMLRTGEKVKAETLLREVFEAEPGGSPLKTRAAHILSHLSHNRQDVNSEIFYLVSAVNNDLVIGLRELPSLRSLALLCYDQGDVEHAYDYLNVALANGVESGSLTRLIEASRSLPLISESHGKEIDELRTRLYFTIVILGVALIVLIIMTVMRHRRIKKIKALSERLINANNTKEIYIAQFLSMCYIYLDKLSQFSKTINRKLLAGKIEEAIRMTKPGGKYLEEQHADFYDNFDNAFLHIYPTFIEDVNRLLRKDEQIVLREGEKMNTDLRILAFMRMGIEDSPQISKILNYSLSTIYSYRNRLKSKAKKRDTFEADIMKISSI